MEHVAQMHLSVSGVPNIFAKKSFFAVFRKRIATHRSEAKDKSNSARIGTRVSNAQPDGAKQKIDFGGLDIVYSFEKPWEITVDLCVAPLKQAPQAQGTLATDSTNSQQVQSPLNKNDVKRVGVAAFDLGRLIKSSSQKLTFEIMMKDPSSVRGDKGASHTTSVTVALRDREHKDLDEISFSLAAAGLVPSALPSLRRGPKRVYYKLVRTGLHSALLHTSESAELVEETQPGNPAPTGSADEEALTAKPAVTFGCDAWLPPPPFGFRELVTSSDAAGALEAVQEGQREEHAVELVFELYEEGVLFDTRLGTVPMTFADLKSATPFPLGGGSGTLRVTAYKERHRKSFVEHIIGGRKLKLATAIDFSHHTAELHEVSPGSDATPFEIALRNVANVLKPYTTQNGADFECYAVGVSQVIKSINIPAAAPSTPLGSRGLRTRTVSVANGGGDDDEEDKLGVPESPFRGNAKDEESRVPPLVRAYRAALEQITKTGGLSRKDSTPASHPNSGRAPPPANSLVAAGHTSFAPAIEKARAMAKKNPDSYTVLLLLTSGLFDDAADTITSLVDADDEPLSVVIVGMGPGPFSAMRLLDGDSMRLKDPQGRYSRRDLVEFIRFDSHINNDTKTVDEESLQTAMLAEVPSQLLEWWEISEDASEGLAHGSQTGLGRGSNTLSRPSTQSGRRK